jgi:hypothetical protein
VLPNWTEFLGKECPTLYYNIARIAELLISREISTRATTNESHHPIITAVISPVSQARRAFERRTRY